MEKVQYLFGQVEMVVDHLILVLVMVILHLFIQYIQFHQFISSISFLFFQIAISSVSESGAKPWYLEECAGTLATAYSSGTTNNNEHDIVSYSSCCFLLFN